MIIYAFVILCTFQTIQVPVQYKSDTRIIICSSVCFAQFNMHFLILHANANFRKIKTRKKCIVCCHHTTLRCFDEKIKLFYRIQQYYCVLITFCVDYSTLLFFKTCNILIWIYILKRLLSIHIGGCYVVLCLSSMWLFPLNKELHKNKRDH